MGVQMNRAVRWGVVLLLLGGAVLAGAVGRGAVAPVTMGPVSPVPAGADTRLNAAVYLGRLQVSLVEHRAALYQSEAAGSAALRAHLAELEDRLVTGAAWLEANRLYGPLTALREYLRLSAGARGGGGRVGADALAGPVHTAAWQAQRALFEAGERLAEASPQAGEPPVPPGDGRPAERTRLLRTLAGVLALAAVVLLLLPPDVQILERRTALPAPRLERLAVRAAGMAGGATAAAETGWRAAAAVAEVALAVTAVCAQEQAGAAAAADAAAAARRLAAQLEDLAVHWRRAPEGNTPDLLTAAAATFRERQGVTRVSDSALDEIERIAAGTADAARVAAALHEQSDQSLGSLTGLMERAGDIDAVVAAIKSIAAQTTMLALNASIEAHRAGVEGSGFRVVAESVRELSRQADQHAREIAVRVQGISEALAAAAHDAWRQRRLSGDLNRTLSQVERQVAAAARAAAAAVATARSDEVAAAAFVAAIQQVAATAGLLALPDVAPLVDQARALAGAVRHLSGVAGEQALVMTEIRRLSEQAQILCRQSAEAAGHTAAGVGGFHTVVDRLRHGTVV